MQHDKKSHLSNKIECIHFKTLSCLWLSFFMLMTFFLSHRLICNAFHGKKKLVDPHVFCWYLKNFVNKTVKIVKQQKLKVRVLIKIFELDNFLRVNLTITLVFFVMVVIKIFIFSNKISNFTDKIYQSSATKNVKRT